MLIGALSIAAATVIAAILVSQPVGTEVIGDTVFINNQRCAVSGRVIPPELRGRWVESARYEGPETAYRGKRLVFNLGSAECIEGFRGRWAEDPERVMSELGLDASEP